jgi:polyphosphate glucokinase
MRVKGPVMRGLYFTGWPMFTDFICNTFAIFSQLNLPHMLSATAQKNKTLLKNAGEKILAIDIGGSHIKATILDPDGKIIQPYEQEITPHPATPNAVMKCIKRLVTSFPSFDKISVGFPGFVKNGVVHTAPNLSHNWHNINFAKMLSANLGKPVRLVNDADMQGLGITQNKGFEILLTLGTGFGTAFMLDGKLLPHLELAHHPITAKKDYDAYIGLQALEKIGEKKWNKRMKKVIAILKTVFNYDHLYIGGGNAVHLHIPLAKDITIVSNQDGIHGGARLWKPENASNGFHEN